MQFSIVALVAALAATSSASYIAPRQYNVTVPYPTGTGAPTGAPSGSGVVGPTATSTIPFTGAAGPVATAGSVFGMVVAGGVALML